MSAIGKFIPKSGAECRIQAADDPFVFRHSVPEPTELSATTTLELHRRGGHVGFVEGTPRRPRYYLDRRIPQWLAG